MPVIANAVAAASATMSDSLTAVSITPIARNIIPLPGIGNAPQRARDTQRFWLNFSAPQPIAHNMSGTNNTSGTSRRRTHCA